MLLTLVLLACGAAPGSAQQSVGGVATLHVPELLSYEITEARVDGEDRLVARVQANREWRLVVQVGDKVLVYDGGPGRDILRPLPLHLLAPVRAEEPAMAVTLARR